MKIAVDFDGTCVDHKYPDIGKDVPGSADTLRDLVDAGHKIFLYTMRSGKYLADAIQWFVDNNIPLSGINTDPEQTNWTLSPKCYANLYIDDAAFGCPLVDVPGFSRKCVDWSAIRDSLFTLRTAAEKAMTR
jgi:hypothetical protein